MRILFALPGLHHVQRGAEVAFLAVATGLARAGHDITLIGSGPDLPGRPYRYRRAASIPRRRFEHFPTLPALRSDTAWEELSFVPGLLAQFRPGDFDATLACSFPFTNWALRRPVLGGRGPKHIFVTQNGVHPLVSNRSEFRLFGCDGVVCINPDYFAQTRDRYPAALIPNGVDLDRFSPGAPARARLGLPDGVPIVLMVSAMIASKNIADGIRAVAALPGAHLVVAGDGPIRAELTTLAAELLPGRYHVLSIASEAMPDLYRSTDVFLHLSRDESFGNVYVEALATGLPIAAWDLPRTRWIVGDDVKYARGDTVDALSTAIGEALKSGDTGRSARLDRARRYDWNAIALQYADFIQEIIAR